MEESVVIASDYAERNEVKIGNLTIVQRWLVLEGAREITREDTLTEAIAAARAHIRAEEAKEIREKLKRWNESSASWAMEVAS